MESTGRQNYYSLGNRGFSVRSNWVQTEDQTQIASALWRCGICEISEVHARFLTAREDRMMAKDSSAVQRLKSRRDR